MVFVVRQKDEPCAAYLLIFSLKKIVLSHKCDDPTIETDLTICIKKKNKNIDFLIYIAIQTYKKEEGDQ